MYYAERKCYKVLCVLVRSLVTVLLKKLELVGMLEYSHAFVGLKAFTSVDTAQVFDKELQYMYMYMYIRILNSNLT